MLLHMQSSCALGHISVSRKGSIPEYTIKKIKRTNLQYVELCDHLII